MKLDDVFDRQVIEKYTIKPEVKKLPKKKLLDLLDKLFREEYQGKTVSYEMLEKEFFVKTTAKTRMHFGFRTPKASFKGHIMKILLGASGEYLSLIKDCQYSHSAKDKKADQNNLHKNTDNWHYFTKTILCEDTYYRVMVDVNESKSKGMVAYNVSLAPCKKEKTPTAEKEKRDSVHSAPETATDLRDRISSNDIISQRDGFVNNNSKKDSKNFEASSPKPSLADQVRRAESKRIERSMIDDVSTKTIDRE